MTDHEQKTGDQKSSKVPSNAVTVPDATHTRFRKPMCRCTEESHGTFALNKLHDHFLNFNHRSVDSCVLCGRNDVYGYYFTMDQYSKKVYHYCSRPKLKNTSSVPTNLDNSNEEDTSPAQPISQSPEISDAESSGIGTGYSSLVSIFNGRNEDVQSSGGLPNKSSHSLPDTMSGEGSSPGSPHRNNK